MALEASGQKYYMSTYLCYNGLDTLIRDAYNAHYPCLGKKLLFRINEKVSLILLLLFLVDWIGVWYDSRYTCDGKQYLLLITRMPFCAGNCNTYRVHTWLNIMQLQ